MSRIGKLPIRIPGDATITVGDVITVSGPKGTLTQPPLSDVTVNASDSEVTVTRNNEGRTAWSQQGLLRSLIANMAHGVTRGFEKKLEVNGTGFRVSAPGEQDLELSLGFSHPVKYHTDADVTLSVAKNVITVSGVSKQQVGQIAADIRQLRSPDPYKGKGIKYVDETIIRKAGKAGAK